MKPDRSHVLLDAVAELGPEGRAGHEAHLELKLWLRMLACTTQIENEIRKRLRAAFEISLPRFDYMAQLYRHPEGLRMKELSRYLMVTGGNVTGLTDELERDQLVERIVDASDRRAFFVRLTPQGHRTFRRMATAHEGWILELMSGWDDRTMQLLYEQLGRLRVHLLPGDPNQDNVK